MTEAAPAPPAAVDVNGPDFASLLAARLCHDFISPTSAIVSGLDLLEDPTAQDMREDAMGLITSSARKLADLLQFSRVAYGASASAESFDSRELHKLAEQGVFAHVRPSLVWDIERAPDRGPGRALGAGRLSPRPGPRGRRPGGSRAGRGPGQSRRLGPGVKSRPDA